MHCSRYAAVASDDALRGAGRAEGGAAQRKYPDPDRFDVLRRPGDQLGFGAGPHACVSMNLARIEMVALFTAASKLSGSQSADPFTERQSGQAQVGREPNTEFDSRHRLHW